ncbi:MAG: DUF86 domain-containing protein [Synechococcaceae cyanobacterium]|nr:DUF86 domain-containing protein [Synechococcaceae cyanobacterium]
MTSRDRTTLRDILRTLQRIERFPIHDQQTFAQTEVLQDAVIRCLQVIGEATRRLSKDIRAQNPEIPWREMAGMRDVLVHAHDQVDLEEVWITLKEQLPPLKAQIEALLEE